MSCPRDELGRATPRHTRVERSRGVESSASIQGLTHVCRARGRRQVIFLVGTPSDLERDVLLTGKTQVGSWSLLCIDRKQ